MSFLLFFVLFLFIYLFNISHAHFDFMPEAYLDRKLEKKIISSWELTYWYPDVLLKDASYHCSFSMW